MFKSLLDNAYANVWTGDLGQQRNINDYILNIKDQQFVVQNMHTNFDSFNTTKIVMDMAPASSLSDQHGASWTPDAGAVSSPAAAPPSAPGTNTGFNMDDFLNIAAAEEETSAAPMLTASYFSMVFGFVLAAMISQFPIFVVDLGRVRVT